MADSKQNVFTDFETGFPEKFDHWIDSAYFATDARYMEGEVLLLTLEGKSPDPEVGEQTMKFSCGQKWETTDKGKTARHETRGYGGKAFRTGTMVQRLLAKATELPGVMDILLERDSELGPRNAKIWEGLGFHWDTVDIDFGAGVGVKQRLMPMKFLGTKVKGQSAPVSSGASNASDAPEKSEEAPAQAAAPKSAGSSAKLKAQLIGLAKSAGEFTDFLTRATEFPDFGTDSDLANDVMDESENGFYARFSGK